MDLKAEQAMPKLSVPEMKELPSKQRLWRADTRVLGRKVVSPRVEHSFCLLPDAAKSRCLSPLREDDYCSISQLEQDDSRSPQLRSPSIVDGRLSSLSPLDGRASSVLSGRNECLQPRTSSQQGEQSDHKLKRGMSHKMLMRSHSSLSHVKDADSISLPSIKHTSLLLSASPSLAPNDHSDSLRQPSPQGLKMLHGYSSTKSLQVAPHRKPSRRALSSLSLQDVPVPFERAGSNSPSKGKRVTPDQIGHHLFTSHSPDR